MNWIIDKDIPIPKRNRPRSPFRSKPRIEYPWDMLEVGDSYFSLRDTDCVRQSAIKYGKDHGKKFTTWQCVKDGKNGCRTWRVE